MCTRLSVLVLAAVVLGLSGVASAAEITWTGPGTDWCEASNWSGGVEPNESDVARFVAPSPIVIQGPGCDANVGWMHGPAFNSSGTQVIDIIDAHVVVQYDWYMMQEHGVSGPNSTVNISGSSVVEILNQGGGLAMRGQDQGITNLNILSTGSGDPCFVANGTIAGADGTNAEFHLYMNGGYFEAGGLSFGDDGGGTFTMTGGTMILGGSGIRMASRAGNVPVQFIMDGDAYIETTGAFGCPTEEAGTGDVFLNSGTLICGGFSSSGFNWTLDIDADATWKIQGDRLVQIQGFIDLGLITGKDNTETPKAVYDGE